MSREEAAREISREHDVINMEWARGLNGGIKCGLNCISTLAGKIMVLLSIM